MEHQFSSLSHQIYPSVTMAPLKPINPHWQGSPLGQAILHHQHHFIDIAKNNDLAICMSDTEATCLWTYSSPFMSSSAEQVHLVEGGQWLLANVGNNALGLAHHTLSTQSVHAHENEMYSVRDWVCYATPIIDPHTRLYYGILNISTKLKKHTNLGTLAVEYCANQLLQTLNALQQDTLYIQAFGSPHILFNHIPLKLSYRQIEILCILALYPQGISLDELHYALYGEEDVSLKTLKAEISHLRGLLNQRIQSRCYRLTCHVQGDFLQLEQLLAQAQFATACHLIKGVFLAKSNSPFLSMWRESFDARLSHYIYQTQDVEHLMKMLHALPDRIEIIQRLKELLPDTHPYYTTLTKHTIH